MQGTQSLAKRMGAQTLTKNLVYSRHAYFLVALYFKPNTFGDSKLSFFIISLISYNNGIGIHSYTELNLDT